MSEDEYRARGYGEASMGLGRRPAVAVVDFQRGLTDSSFPLGGSPYVASAVRRTAELLTAARTAGILVIQGVLEFRSPSNSPKWKIAGLTTSLCADDPAAEVDARLFDPDNDLLIPKTAPSLFFQTQAISTLITQRIDTVIVAGCTTSGCVRATVVDAFSYGFHVAVPRDCVADFDEQSHENSLRDIGRRYADIICLSDALHYLEETVTI